MGQRKELTDIQKITPFLWFDKNCEEAMKFYTSVFKSAPGKWKSSKIIEITKYPSGIKSGPMKGMDGKVLNGVFELNGQTFMALDGGRVFEFSGAVSFLVDCKDQKEVDYFWKKLSAEPKAEQCGWLKDKYGIFWQIIPTALGKLMTGPDKEGVARVTQAMLKMKKIIVKDLQKAYGGK